MFPSFRLKIVLWYAVVALLTLFIFRMVSVQIIRQSLFTDLDNSLRGEVRWAWQVLNTYMERKVPQHEIFQEIVARSALSPRKEFIEIYDIQSGSYFRSPNLENIELPEVYSLRPFGQAALVKPITIEEFRDHPVRLLGFRGAYYEIYIAYPTTDIEAALEEIVSSFFLLIPGAFILFVAGGLFLLSRFLRSFNEVTVYTRELLDQPLEGDLPEVSPRTRRELGVLIDGINPIVERMRNSMKQALSFASLASHELRTPLAVVRNELESVLHPKTPTGVLRRTVASTYDEILRMSRTVEALLDLGTMQAGTFRLEQERVDFHVVLKEFYDEAVLLSREKDISVVLRRGPAVFVNVDVNMIRQMLFNLLDNAIKHTPEGGRIRLSHEVRGSEVVLHFSDTGPGIPPDEVPRIFDPFHKGNGKSYGIAGAGLGLSLVKWIVEAHKGSVSVESRLGTGTEFIISLPVVTTP